MRSVVSVQLKCFTIGPIKMIKHVHACLLWLTTIVLRIIFSPIDSFIQWELHRHITMLTIIMWSPQNQVDKLNYLLKTKHGLQPENQALRTTMLVGNLQYVVRLVQLLQYGKMASNKQFYLHLPQLLTRFYTGDLSTAITLKSTNANETKLSY